jgi:hypothetical protein
MAQTKEMMMTRPPQDQVDEGVLYTIIKRFESERLPRALALKEKVDRGEVLSNYDLSFLEEVFHDSHYIAPYLSRHPKYNELATSVLALYKEITSKGLENEKAASGKGG